MKIKFKKLSENAVTPSYAKPGDAGLDLTATRIGDKNDKPITLSLDADFTKNDLSMIIYHTDIAVEIPYGFVGLIFPRSSISNQPLTLANCVGIIDSGYRGEIQVRMKFDAPAMGAILTEAYALERKEDSEYKLPTGISTGIYKVYDRIAQLVIIPYPEIELEEVDELSLNTERGIGGFGSTTPYMTYSPMILDLTDNKKAA